MAPCVPLLAAASLLPLLAELAQARRLQRTPPMGWSSWYAFGAGVNQTVMEATFHKLTNRSVLPSSSRSLQDVGYVFANIDDGWQACHTGVDGSFHSATGEPLVNTTTFPSMSAMTHKAHAMGLKPGFYINNYICAEGMPLGGVGGSAYMLNMQGTVNFLTTHQFDYVKIDSGSVYNDMQLWHNLIAASDHPMVIENCHQGHLEPNATWCPFDLFRTSGDLHVVGLDVEILATATTLSHSRPGCWAYPDTLDAGAPGEARSQFGAFAIMSAPLVLSFNILDDSKLLPIWDIITNDEAIQVNQQWAGSPGKLIRKWAPHLPSEPVFPWAESCNKSDPTQQGWRYDVATHRLAWQPPASAARAPASTTLCLSTASRAVAVSGSHLTSTSSGALSLAPCGIDSGQVWHLEGGRLWQGDKRLGLIAQVGSLTLQPCNSSRPGQRWRLSAAQGHSQQCTVQNDLSFRKGGCWEITACEVSENAEVGVNFGCKALPASDWTNLCDANGAWSFNANGTITSVMDGKCLQVDPRDHSTVNVAKCTSGGFKWIINGSSIQPASMPGHCVDSDVSAPPPHTTGRCAAVVVTNDAGGAGSWAGLKGPAISLAPGESCDPNIRPGPTQSFSIGDGSMLRAGAQCVAARHGSPSPFGPLQLWAKPQPGGAVAVLLLNRNVPGDTAILGATVELAELPGLALPTTPGGRVRVRDIWARQDRAPLEVGDPLHLSAAAGDSQFLLLAPEASVPTVATFL
mmetsp:Transcript_69541/g.148735  ORF Transcript_69541/g.148735 Transcript_69541/m.148735 type:complete len:743 (+) Transcript_69541:45-2273(+)